MDYVFSFQKIIDGNGLSISITGMFIVFSSLLTIAIFVLFLPKVLIFFNRFFPEKEEEVFAVTDSVINDKGLIAAIGFALLKSRNNSN